MFSLRSTVSRIIVNDKEEYIELIFGTSYIKNKETEKKFALGNEGRYT